MALRKETRTFDGRVFKFLKYLNIRTNKNVDIVAEKAKLKRAGKLVRVITVTDRQTGYVEGYEIYIR
jgi:hypothetical protein